MALTDEDVREILRIVDESGLDELLLETERFKLHVLRGGMLGERSFSAATPEPEPTPESTPSSAEDGLTIIPAPMLGTFYRAEGPGKPPFVDVGTEVRADTIVCIIEVMKMMNSVSAGVSGTIVEVCPENAELVEFGTPLFRVRPA